MMLRMKDLSKIYRVDNTLFYALNSVNLEIGKGEMIAIRGRSGAGKSTLLHILGCLDTYEEGEYWINGVSTMGMTGKQLAYIRNTQVGFVMQDFSLINHKTALYNVATPLLFNPNIRYSQMKNLAMQALNKLNLASQARKNVINMSGGQRQRIAIARAIVNNCPIIMADEPTGNLDSNTAAEIMDIFTQLNKQGKTIIIVTHDETVSGLCHRNINLHDGKVTSNIK